jgi:hypothetical protein
MLRSAPQLSAADGGYRSVAPGHCVRSVAPQSNRVRRIRVSGSGSAPPSRSAWGPARRGPGSFEAVRAGRRCRSRREAGDPKRARERERERDREWLSRSRRGSRGWRRSEAASCSRAASAAAQCADDPNCVEVSGCRGLLAPARLLSPDGLGYPSRADNGPSAAETGMMISVRPAEGHGTSFDLRRVRASKIRPASPWVRAASWRIRCRQSKGIEHESLCGPGELAAEGPLEFRDQRVVGDRLSGLVILDYLGTEL